MVNNVRNIPLGIKIISIVLYSLAIIMILSFIGNLLGFFFHSLGIDYATSTSYTIPGRGIFSLDFFKPTIIVLSLSTIFIVIGKQLRNGKNLARIAFGSILICIFLLLIINPVIALFNLKTILPYQRFDLITYITRLLILLSISFIPMGIILYLIKNKRINGFFKDKVA